jgi:hypothetical protein
MWEAVLAKMGGGFMRLASALLLSLLLLVGGCAVAPRQEQAPAPPPAYPERPPVPAPVYPEFAHGAIDPSVTQENIQQTVCASGYTRLVRPPTSYTNRIKVRLMLNAGIDPSHAKDFELDHNIPLALGGAPRAVENLQLHAWDGADGAKRKDRIEVKLQCLVCTEQVTLTAAQHEIADWQAAYHHYATVKCKRSKRQSVPEAEQN